MSSIHNYPTVAVHRLNPLHFEEEEDPNVPAHPSYATLESRLKSFDHPAWPIHTPVSVQSLAEAGLYFFGSYEGFDDCVKCFHCDKGLCCWRREDTAWSEHKRCKPDCKFVLENHPDNVLKRQQEEADIMDITTRDPNEVVEDWMKGIMVRKLKEECPLIAEETVKEVLLRKCNQDKKPFEEFKQLKDAVMAVISDEEEEGPSSQSSSVSFDSSISDPGYASQDSQDTRMLCKVCLDKDLGVTFIPCGHCVTCQDCAKELNKCPYCRRTVNSKIKTYLS